MLTQRHPPKINPLEREFEAWVIRGIQDYFELREQRVVIFAFSPFYEKNFPADAIADLPSLDKGFAIQFKRPHAHKYGYSWELDDEQHTRISGFESIFYCFPTFVNREAHKAALHHALFWHPKWSSAWLGEPILIDRNEKNKVSQARFLQQKSAFTASTSALLHKSQHEGGIEFGRTLRWGGLIENAERCFLGAKTKDFEAEINRFIKMVQDQKREEPAGSSPNTPAPPHKRNDALYAVLFERKKK
jgi:hypothetical protein